VHHAGDAAEGESFANLGIALVEQFALRGTWTKLESMEIATDPEFWVAERSRPQAAGVDDSKGCGLLLRAQARAKAEEVARLVQGTSALESQAVDADAYRRLVERSYHELMAGSRRRLWGD
jgi:hypothetical protein